MDIRMLLKDKKIILGGIGMVLIVLIVIIAGTKSKADVPAKEGYKTITDVEGIKFDVDKTLSDASTAVLEISDRIDFIDYMTYSYKNGEDTYLLFNIQKFIVVAKKGTCFNFRENGVEKSLEENSLNGIWFAPTGKIPAVSAEGKPYSIEVEGQVVITNNIYNDFYGTLTIMTKDGEEWSLFAGVTTKGKESLGNMVSYVTESLSFYEREDGVMENYEVSVDDGSFSNVTESIQITETVPDPGEDSRADETVPDPVETPIPTEKVENPATDMPEETTPPEVEEIKDIVELPEETQEEPQEEPADIPQEQPEDDVPKEEPPKTVTIEEDTRFSIGNNQSSIEIANDKAYTSSIYFMLGIGNAGYMDVFSEDLLTLEGAFIRPVRLIDAAEAKELVDAYCKSESGCYDSLSAPDGCHFEAIEYDVKYSTQKDYTNIRLCGLDGDTLKFRGIAYSQRTYDILSDTQKDGWYCGNICFYIVPNGCKEYALKCGSGTERNGGYNAYYRITTGKGGEQ